MSRSPAESGGVVGGAEDEDCEREEEICISWEGRGGEGIEKILLTIFAH